MTDTPWTGEPDVLYWTDNATGFDCCLIRAAPKELGHLCGYVRIPETHPCYGKPLPDLDVHGDITYDKKSVVLTFGGPSGHWIGFDCAHHRDYVPGVDIVLEKMGLDLRARGEKTYKDVWFVKEECRKLAEQLARIKE